MAYRERAIEDILDVASADPSTLPKAHTPFATRCRLLAGLRQQQEGAPHRLAACGRWLLFSIATRHASGDRLTRPLLGRSCWRQDWAPTCVRL